MSIVVLPEPPKPLSYNNTILESGEYAFIGFKRRKLFFRQEDSTVVPLYTWSPVLGKLNDNGNVTDLYIVNRNDLTYLKEPRKEWGKPESATYDNTGNVVSDISAILNYYEDSMDNIWLNIIFPKYSSKVMTVRTTQFLGITKTGTKWRTKVYDINLVDSKVFHRTQQSEIINSILNNKDWDLADLKYIQG